MTLLEQWEPGATEVTIWDLEMTDPSALLPGSAPSVDVHLMTADRPAPELSCFFYQLVGAGWHWTDRLAWTDEQWRDWVDRPEHRLITCWGDGVPAGYIELEAQSPSTVEIAYFGLAPGFIGQGLGGWLLTNGVEAAWAMPGTERVWLHTCSLDGPHALANYQARGFTEFGQRREWRMLKG